LKAAPAPSTTYNPPQPLDGVIPLEFLLATPAKVVCSAIFLSGRDWEEVKGSSLVHALVSHHMHDVLVDLVDVAIDEESASVTVSFTPTEDRVDALVGGYRAFYENWSSFEADYDAERARILAAGTVSRTARFVNDSLGSVILPLPGRAPEEPQYTPATIETSLPPAETQAWPMGDVVEGKPDALSAKFGDAVQLAFADPAAHTAGVVVLHRGRIVAEQYRPGVDHTMQLESWSMGKSLTATLIGVLVQQGHLTLEQPAPVPEWQTPGDPRQKITIRDLLQMSSGLNFRGQPRPRQEWTLGVPDHLYFYSDVVDAFRYSVSAPLEFEPGTVGRYLNCDPLTLGYIVKMTVEGLGEDYLTWPQRALFDQIGIRRQVLETDWYGQFLLTGFDYGTPRNWARIGQLHLQDGVWDGRRILPEGWSDFVSTPAPGWDQAQYGGQWWINTPGEFRVPGNTYMCGGFGEQRTFVVPQHDLVVVRMGHLADTSAARDTLNDMLEAIMGAVEAA